MDHFVSRTFLPLWTDVVLDCSYLSLNSIINSFYDSSSECPFGKTCELDMPHFAQSHKVSKLACRL